MVKQRESSAIVKNRIMEVACNLFAQYGVKNVSIRRIAAEAGIHHSLVIRYFGSKANMVTEILQREVASLASLSSVDHEKSLPETLTALRGLLLNSLSARSNTMRLIMRSGLDGLSPESFVEGNAVRAARILADWIGSHQTDKHLPDAKLTSMVIMAALFSMVSIAPWLMTSVGLPPEDFDKRKNEIIDVIIWMISRAIDIQHVSVDDFITNNEMQEKPPTP